MNQVCILGNGKSLENFDFTKLKGDTIGLCLAYRYWEKVNWYPTHYVCIDSVVIKSNLEDIKKLIVEEKCKTFLLSAHILEDWPECKEFKNVHYCEYLKQNTTTLFRYMPMWCSGSAAYIYALLLAYDDISLFGMDCNYVEFLPITKQLEDGTLLIEETPDENPNYFFNDYQRKGDKYNVPNAERCHKLSWLDSSFITHAYVQLRGQEKQPPTRVMNYNKEDVKSIREFFTTRKIEEYYEDHPKKVIQV
jgi:hypothetical protein